MFGLSAHGKPLTCARDSQVICRAVSVSRRGQRLFEYSDSQGRVSQIVIAWGELVYERILRQMHEKIRTFQYVMTVHAEEEMNDDDLTIFDIERAILTGRITERQIDHHTGEWKYVVAGESVDGRQAEVVAKLSITDKLVIITVYREG